MSNLVPATTPKALSGREYELDLIDSFLNQMTEDGAALVLVGEAGVGKTALLNAACEAASQAGMRVLRAAGAEFEADMAFSTLHQTLDALQQTITTLSDNHQYALHVAMGLREGSIPGPLIVSSATLAVLRSAAEDRPVLVVVDDLPWVDRASAKVLAFVARRLAGSRIGFLSAARSQYEGIFYRAGLPSLELDPLDDEAALELVKIRFPTLTRRMSRSVLESAKGNPLALLEFGTALSRSGFGASQVLGPYLPQSRRLQLHFMSQIERLPAGCRWPLLVLALQGSGDRRTLRCIDPDGEFHDELGVLKGASLVDVGGSVDRVEFRHPLIRGAVVELATDDELRRAHVALAAAFDDEPDRRAWHLSEAATGPNELVASELEQAGHGRLRRGDAIGSVVALTRAAQLSPVPADRGRRLAEAAYIGADLIGETLDTSALLSGEGGDSAEYDASLKAAAAAAIHLLIGDGDVDTAHGLLVGAIEHRAKMGDGFDAALHEALYTLLRVCYFGGRAELWTPFEKILDRLGPYAPADVEVRARTQGDPVSRAAEALPRLDAAIDDLGNETDPTQIIRTATAASFLDRLTGCRPALWRLVRAGRADGAMSAGISGLILLGLDDFWTGQWDEAEELSGEVVDLCETHGLKLFAPEGQRIQALVAAGRGDYERTRSLTDAMLEWAAPRRVRSLQCSAWHARSLAALGCGKFEEAYQEALKITPAGVLMSYNPHVLCSALDFVEAAARTGRVGEATLHANALRDARIGQLSSRLALVEKGSAAIVAPDPFAIALFEEALAVPEVDRWPFDLARVHLAFGERLRRIHAGRKSRQHLNEALQGFERLGAKPWVNRAAGELRASGEVNHLTQDSLREALTPQEQRIAELAAAGLTNKEIGERLYLSHRTISGHLHRVFPKLGITSRAALRDGLASRAQEREN
jgi:DNA-binding CsgD family transcriptional regulator